MSRYSAEDALAEVYDAELCSSDGEVRLYVGRNVVLTTPDDVLGTVLATVAEKARDHYPGCRGLDSDLAAGGGDIDTVLVHRTFNSTAFATHVAPYIEHNYPNDYHNYTAAMVKVEGLPLPEECLPIDRPAWGLYYTQLGRLFLILRKMKRLPPIEHAFQPTTDTCNLLQLASRPHCNGIPANGSRFQEWERQMIETMKPGGEQASFVTHGDCEYLVPYRLYDPFVTIGSQFYALAALPELTPSGAREYGPSDTEQDDDESVTSGDEVFKECETQEPPPKPHVAPKPKPANAHEQPAPKDELTQVRGIFREYLTKPPNLSDPAKHDLREDCKVINRLSTH